MKEIEERRNKEIEERRNEGKMIKYERKKMNKKLKSK